MAWNGTRYTRYTRPRSSLKDGIADKTRAELNVIAEELGIDPSDYTNKAAIIEAINAFIVG